MIEFKEIQPRRYNVIYSNGVLLGEVLADIDGFLIFWPELKGGFWSEEILIQIGMKLRELNEPWKKEIDNYFEKARSVGYTT